MRDSSQLDIQASLLWALALFYLSICIYLIAETQGIANWLSPLPLFSGFGIILNYRRWRSPPLILRIYPEAKIRTYEEKLESARNFSFIFSPIFFFTLYFLWENSVRMKIVGAVGLIASASVIPLILFYQNEIKTISRWLLITIAILVIAIVGMYFITTIGESRLILAIGLFVCGAFVTRLFGYFNDISTIASHIREKETEKILRGRD